MPSHLYMIGLMTTITCVESPDVVEERINEARLSDSDTDFIELTHMAQLHNVDNMVGGVGHVPTGRTHDSYAPLKVRYDHVQAVRAYHAQEEEM